ncbi:hypothetical protein [Rhizobium sp. L1K21]|uniref:hypothetical protein n=1 Tax=Rhizobium sp. L1K21 TaxID=2954933 RepID=UPI002092584D|nr:hypothetical protein [Rhizobium sp. L1K21]MCO6186271.1 hypothetical protein [Rhizobium sp. L1K21]
MTEVTNELMYELLKRMQTDISDVKDGVRELKLEVNAIRGTLVSVHQDIHNIYGILGNHSDRLARIERRLELHELAERSQSQYDPEN